MQGSIPSEEGGRFGYRSPDEGNIYLKEENIMAKLKSRRLIVKEEQSEEIKETLVYCRKCMKSKKQAHFHTALDLDLDKNLLLSVCKECVNEIFNRYLVSSNNNMNEAVYKTCKKLNILYSERVVDSLKLHLAKKEAEGKEIEIFGIYKAHLGRFLSLNEGIAGTFEYETSSFSKENVIEEELEGETEDTISELKSTWGDGLTRDDYEFLERELSNWKQSHKCDTYAELVLLKEICYVQLDMKKARIEDRDTSALLKKLLDAMKVSALDPAKANQASSGTGKETWGMFIKNIEETTPAEYFADKELFKDFDNIDIYFQNYIRRPAINFYSSSRNLELLDEEKKEDTDIEDIVIPLEDKEGE